MNTFKKPRPKNAKHRIGDIIQVDNAKTFFSLLRTTKTIIEGKIVLYCTPPDNSLAYMVQFEEFMNIPLLVYEDEIIEKVKVEFT